jgi:succinate dehydrogenase / fumarate reductase, membrane anchor subunit
MDTPSLRTAAAKVRYLGSARAGTHHMWHMRLTSAALIPLTIAFVWLVLSLLGKDYNQVRAALGMPLPALTLLLFIGAGVYHMQLGMQTIIEDYVHGEGARTVAIAGNLFFCAAIGLACVYAVLKLSFV